LGVNGEDRQTCRVPALLRDAAAHDPQLRQLRPDLVLSPISIDRQVLVVASIRSSRDPQRRPSEGKGTQADNERSDDADGLQRHGCGGSSVLEDR
jgi:hypothetical protein